MHVNGEPALYVDVFAVEMANSVKFQSRFSSCATVAAMQHFGATLDNKVNQAKRILLDSSYNLKRIPADRDRTHQHSTKTPCCASSQSVETHQ